MNIIVVINSAMMRNMLAEIFTENGDEICLLTANWKQALKLSETQKIDLIIIGDNIINTEDDYFFFEAAKINPQPNFYFTGKFSQTEITVLKKKGFFNISDYPEIDRINDDEYRKNIIETFSEVLPATSNNIKNELKDKYKSIINDSKNTTTIDHIVIGSSTGGPKALKMILDFLPADLPVAISIVQHLEEGHEEGLAKYLNRDTKLNVRLAVNKDNPKPGEVILAVQGKHLVVKNKTFYYEDGENVNFQKPAIDNLFKTASASYKNNLLGILLTGMGQDGAFGCVDIIKNGGFTIVQDKESSTVFGMPKVAIELNGASIVLPLDKIAEQIIYLLKTRNNYGK